MTATHKHLGTHEHLGILLAALACTPLTAQETADQVRAKLEAGNRRFVAGQSAPPALGEGLRRTLERGQRPAAVVVCCADARVPPEHVFNAGLGELFVVRTAGHVLDDEALASVEYAAEQLGVPLCVVLGHEGCGAVGECTEHVRRAMAGRPARPESPALERLLAGIEPAVRRALEHDLKGPDLRTATEEEHARATAVDCLRRSPLLRRLAGLERFQVLPARYHLHTGAVQWLPARPLPVEPEAAAAAAEPAPPSMAPHVALRLLQAGHRRFLGAGAPAGEIGPARREALTESQQPLAVVVTCADARVAPEHVFDAGLGELVVVRIEGNVLTDTVLASIEHAALRHGLPLVVVMGHTSCSAVRTAVEHAHDPRLSPHMRALVERIAPALERARWQTGPGLDVAAATERAHALRFVEQARQQSPVLRRLEEAGRLAILPVIYDLGAGDLEWLAADGAAPAASEPLGSAPVGPGAAPGGETAPRRTAPAPQGVPAGDGSAQPPRADGAGAPPIAEAPTAPGPQPGEPRQAPGTGDHRPAGLRPRPRAGRAAAQDQDATEGWLDPVAMLGIAGIASLLAAAFLRLRARR